MTDMAVKNAGATPVQKNDKETSNSKTISRIAGGAIAAGGIADVYLSASKSAPKKYMKQLKGLAEAVDKAGPGNFSEKFVNALSHAQERLSRIIDTKYTFSEKLQDQIRIDSHGSFIHLAESGVTSEEAQKLGKEGSKLLGKLSKTGKKALNDGMIKTMLRQCKWSAIATVGGMALPFAAKLFSKPEKKTA